ncbi:MAG: sugar ABC transporter substrate-binding protein [Spirochaetia bacterium]|jgi:ABC-type glycerol-3-phosphate transport system substrate-binding protein|nr:sugar ABC transporter substrate-binding protein [Spirochaetia bacterium]
MKKLLVTLMVIAITFGSLFANGTHEASSSAATESNSNDNITIKWISQGTGASGWEGKTKPILEKFEEETGYKVDSEFYSFNDLFDVLETKCAAKASDFDVMSVDVTYVAKYGSSGYLEPLDKYFSADEKAKWDSASYAASVWNGTMYAAPENTSSQLLWYNKDLLDEAGITIPENGPDNRLTYEQIAEMAKKALAKLDPTGSKGIIGFDFQQVSRVYQMNMLPNSMGGKNISDNGLTLDGVVNTKPWIDAMTWYQNLVKDGIASRGYDADQLTQQFYAGKMIFMIGGTWTQKNTSKDVHIGCTYAPCFKGYEDKAATSTGSWYFGVNSQSKNKDAAAKFVKFFTLGEGNDMWLKINGDVPSRLDKQQEMMNGNVPYLTIAAYEAAHTAVARAVTPMFGEYSNILNQAWEDVRNGADVKSTLQDAVEQFNLSVASYK